MPWDNYYSSGLLLISTLALVCSRNEERIDRLFEQMKGDDISYLDDLTNQHQQEWDKAVKTIDENITKGSLQLKMSTASLRAQIGLTNDRLDSLLEKIEGSEWKTTL